MRATFLPVTPGALGRVLPFMSRLYEHDELTHDPVRARAVSEWLLTNPDYGAIWLIEADGTDVGYMVVTVCVSIEFHGRFALLDELYVDPPWRRHGRRCDPKLMTARTNRYDCGRGWSDTGDLNTAAAFDGVNGQETSPTGSGRNGDLAPLYFTNQAIDWAAGDDCLNVFEWDANFDDGG